MKILICGDIHWSTYSSIIRRRTPRYSQRLENLITSVNWVEETAAAKNCDCVIYLGDFFDKPELTVEEITALKEIKWAPRSHMIIVGNHELGLNNLDFNSASLFRLSDVFDVVDTPQQFIYGNSELDLLPYQLGITGKSLSEFFPNKIESAKNRILLSHNDIKGVQMGAFLSDQGMDITDIETNYDLCINGHLHNGTNITNKVINLGNLTGQNFGEDANKYSHRIFILDTDTLQYEEIENPFAFNFYKIDLTTELFPCLKNNAVLTVKVRESDIPDTKALLENDKSIVESRLIVERDLVTAESTEDELIQIDHLEEFKKFILETIGESDIVLHELNEVCK